MLHIGRLQTIRFLNIQHIQLVLTNIYISISTTGEHIKILLPVIMSSKQFCAKL